MISLLERVSQQTQKKTTVKVSSVIMYQYAVHFVCTSLCSLKEDTISQMMKIVINCKMCVLKATIILFTYTNECHFTLSYNYKSIFVTILNFLVAKSNS